MNTQFSNRRKNYLFFFLVSILIINIIQAYYSNLWDDESYYTVFSRHLDYGFFDHPPMTALFIKIGYAIIPNALGIRLLFIFSFTGTIYLLHEIIHPQDFVLFWAIVFSVIPMHILGMLAIPDGPLIFFSTLYAYLAFRCPSSKHYLFYPFVIGFVEACLLYSKYHGILIIICFAIYFIKERRWWIAHSIGFLLFIPHLIWQLRYGLPTFYFQLMERHEPYFRWAFTLDYIGGQIAFWGPIIGWLLIGVLFLKDPNRNPLAKLSRNISLFVLGVFLISTHKGFVEANWTDCLYPFLIIVFYSFLKNKNGLRKIVIYSLPLSIAVLILIRIILVFPLIPKLDKGNEFYNRPQWANQMKTIIKNYPLLYVNEYQTPSQFSFYYPTTPISNYALGRVNQFSIWNFDATWIDSTIIIRGFSFCHCDTIHTIKGDYYFKVVSAHQLHEQTYLSDTLCLGYRQTMRTHQWTPIEHPIKSLWLFLKSHFLFS
ncbi:MAG: glycosyltransferase family 39 protein [Phycisphaerales bacterium]|nr:glycosyltransferase family 39 protein [Phycisphaerales bacterium]